MQALAWTSLALVPTSISAAMMHQVHINDLLPKLTRQIASDSLGGRQLLGQSTASCILYLTEGEEPITQSIFVVDQKWARIIYAERFGTLVFPRFC